MTSNNMMSKLIRYLSLVTELLSRFINRIKIKIKNEQREQREFKKSFST